MGLVPQSVAINELNADDDKKNELRSLVEQASDTETGPIETVELFENDDERRLVLNCESGRLVIETSLKDRWTRIKSAPNHR